MADHEFASFLAVILAAGEGRRMKSALPKVMHAVAALPMLGHAMQAARDAGAAAAAIVVPPSSAMIVEYAAGLWPEAVPYEQERRLGTAHALLAARRSLSGFGGPVVVLYGDTPLVGAATIRRLAGAVESGAALAILGFDAADPNGYGRILLDVAGAPAAIREQRDASEAERALRLCNSGLMAFRAGLLPELAEAIAQNNAAGEYYLTDAVAIARSRGLPVALVRCDEDEVQGVNDRAQLARAEAAMQKRLREAAFAGGVTLIAPDTVTFAFDTTFGQDVTVEPHVVFGPGCVVEDGATVKAFSHLEHTHIGRGATVGPFARFRPGARIGAGAKIGNFVEIKNAVIEDKAKVNHLSYVGDARVGAGANVGAGVITCNYDGFDKHRTDIGEGAFIGSNSALVAPVSIGAGAYVGSGTVVTRDVTPDALAVARPRQSEIPGWASRMRARRAPKAKPERE